MQKISDKVQTALQKDPAHPDKVAADLGMQVVHADGVAPGQAGSRNRQPTRISTRRSPR